MSNEASIDRLVETGQISYDDANRLREEARPKVARSTGAAAVRSSVRRPRPSRRGGRAFPEPSDSELDTYWQMHPDETPRTPEEVAETRANISMLRDQLLQQKLRAAGSDSERNRILAIERARRERRGAS